MEGTEELCFEEELKFLVAVMKRVWRRQGEDVTGRQQDKRTPHLSIHRFLKASSYVFTLRVVRSDRAVTIVAAVTIVTGMTGVTGVRVSVALLSGWVLHAPWLGALLHRVGPLCDDRSLSRLDTGYLVDLDLGLRRVLNVDIHQGWMERHWRRTEPRLTE